MKRNLTFGRLLAYTPKSILRALLLFPIRPSVFAWEVRIMRQLGLLPKPGPRRWPPKQILVVNLSNLVGDALMMLPLLDKLASILPEANIDVITEAPMEHLLQRVRYLDRVIGFAPRGFRIPLFKHYFRIFGLLGFVRRELMEHQYDLALLPRWGTDPRLSTYLAAMSATQQLCGHYPGDETETDDSFPGMDSLLTWVSHGGHGLAEGIREQRLLVACGLLENLDLAEEELRPIQSVIEMSHAIDIDAFMKKLGIGDPATKLILLSPGASHPARRWPPERFAALGERLFRKTGAIVCTIGATGDQDLGRRIEALSNGTVRNLAGKTTFLEVISLIHRSSLLVTNDSGPGHIGGSVGVPTLVLSVCPKTSALEHMNSPRRIRPVGPKTMVLQPDSPADGCIERCLMQRAHCIRGVQIDAVEEAALALCGDWVDMEPHAPSMMRL